VVATTRSRNIPTLEELGIGSSLIARWAGDSSPAKSMKHNLRQRRIFLPHPQFTPERGKPNRAVIDLLENIAAQSTQLRPDRAGVLLAQKP